MENLEYKINMIKDFNKLISTFKNSIKTWEYFVNWNKVFLNSSEFEIVLNKLNYLLGKEDIETEFHNLFKSNPDIIKAIPALLAVRDLKIEIFKLQDKKSEFFDFSNPNRSSNDYFMFMRETGLIKLFQKDGIKNLVDYVTGVEVGLDSNGRKNRGGTIMENIVELFIKEFSYKYKYEYLTQANATKIKNKWNIEINVNKSERSFDFVVYNPQTKKLKLFETNFYNGGGSKLKAVCGEFKNLYTELKEQGIDFIWITDGLGWHTTKRPLEEVYNHNEYVFNLKMMEDEILDELNW